MFIPAASAQMATIDIWQKAKPLWKKPRRPASPKYVLGFLDKLANKIESSYRISNFLYTATRWSAGSIWMII